MSEKEVRLSLQSAAQEMERRFPGRGFAFFVFPAEPGQTAQYVSNADRAEVLKAMKAIHDKGAPGLAGNHSRN